MKWHNSLLVLLFLTLSDVSSINFQKNHESVEENYQDILDSNTITGKFIKYQYGIYEKYLLFTICFHKKIHVTKLKQKISYNFKQI